MSGLSARANPLRLLHLAAQAILFLPKIASSRLSNEAGLSLIVHILASLLGPLLSNENLLSDLRKK